MNSKQRRKSLLLSRHVNKKWWSYGKFFKHRLDYCLDKMPDKPVTPEAFFMFRPWKIDPRKVRVVFVVSGGPFKNTKFNNGHPISLLSKSELNQIPPSYKAFVGEYGNNLRYTIPKHQTFASWQTKGIMMMYQYPFWDYTKHNRTAIRGWEYLAYDTCCALSDKQDKVAFVFLGKGVWPWSYAIDESKHLVLRLPYPTNYSGFLGCKVFNTLLKFLGEDRNFFKLPTSKERLTI